MRLWILILLALGYSLLSAHAALVSAGALAASGGGAVSNGLYQGWVALGMPVAGTRLTSTTWLSSAGFPGTFLLCPDCDFNGNGIPDEDDPDDDDDGLADADELNGLAFNPVTYTDPFNPDTDGDGMSDQAEYMAGTNPRDPGSRLVVTVTTSEEEIFLRWDGREGRTYDILFGATVPELVQNAGTNARITAQGGTGPWRVVPLTQGIPGTDAAGFFRLKVNAP